MEVDFDNLRKQTAYALDRAIKILNMGLIPDGEEAHYSYQDEDKKWHHIRGDVLINASDIQKAIDEVRQNIGILCCCYNEQAGYKQVYDEVEASGGIAWFNPDESDE